MHDRRPTATSLPGRASPAALCLRLAMTALLALCGLMLPATAQDVPTGAGTPGKEAGASKMAQASAELTAQGADGPVTAERRADWPAQTGHTLLTVTLPDGGDVTLDRAMLDSLPQTAIETSTIWTEGVQQFSGVALTGLIDALGAEGRVAVLTAANGYEIRIPLDQPSIGGAVLAHLRNGREMSLRDKGPLWLVYPYDSDAAYRTEVVYANSIWQLDHIRFSR